MKQYRRLGYNAGNKRGSTIHVNRPSPRPRSFAACLAQFGPIAGITLAAAQAGNPHYMLSSTWLSTMRIKIRIQRRNNAMHTTENVSI